MKKEDITFAALLLEALGILLGIIYVALQIGYGVYYGVSPIKIIMNVLVALVVYTILTILMIHPERINGLSPDVCTGDIRKYSIRMVVLVKFIFIASLMVPCMFDVLGIEIRSATSLIVIILIFAIVIYYECRIIRILRNRQ